MPAPVSPSLRRPTAPARTYTVRPGDTLSSIAARQLGDAGRWKEIYSLNKGAIGADPAHLRLGMVLKMPAGKPAPQPEPVRPDADRDGVLDRYDAAPRDASDRRWNQQAADEFAAFVTDETARMRQAGIEVDCSDFAVLMLRAFCASVGMTSPLEKQGKWNVYTPGASGGLPNVNGANHVLSGLYADRLAKAFTRGVNDADGNGVAGAAASGEIDVADLRGGDLLFYDWDADGRVDHTIQVLGVAQDGTVEIAYGTYNNLDPTKPVEWKNLDLQPIQRLSLKPGSENHFKYLGAGNRLWGVRRYTFAPDHTAAPVVKPPAPAPVEPAPQKRLGLWGRIRSLAVRAFQVMGVAERRTEWDLKRVV